MRNDSIVKILLIILSRLVKRCIADHIFYPHYHFYPIFCLNLRKKDDFKFLDFFVVLEILT